MAHSAKYFRKLADRYEALANTMRTKQDRETVAAIAAQYLQAADETKRSEHRRAQHA
jgi:hypothetical protein